MPYIFRSQWFVGQFCKLSTVPAGAEQTGGPRHRQRRLQSGHRASQFSQRRRRCHHGAQGRCHTPLALTRGAVGALRQMKGIP